MSRLHSANRQPTRRCRFETLERRNLLAAVQIFAAGQMGEETVELRIDGQPVQAWENVGGDFAARQFVPLSYSAPGTIRPEQVQVAFTNDFFDPAAGIDRNVYIDAIVIDGVRFETEDPSVESTGTWTTGLGAVPGFYETEVLHTAGHFQYAPVGNEGSRIVITANGQEGVELLELQIDGEAVGTFEVATAPREFVFFADSIITPSQVRIAFLNDAFDSENGIDNNLRVDHISIDGIVYETEAPSVFSTGTWKAADQVQPGFREDEWLHIPGYFQYGLGNATGDVSLETSIVNVAEADFSADVTIVRRNGSAGLLTIEYATVPITALPADDYVGVSGTLVLEPGETRKTITIPLINDAIVEPNEQFALTIDNLRGGGTLLAPRTATITIDDDDSVQASGDGLLGEYFDSLDFVDRFADRIDSTVNFNWTTGAPVAGMGVDTFSVRWTGQIEPRFTETYTFETRSDDGVRLWIDGQPIIDRWVDQAATPHVGNITLNGGQLYEIRMEYYERAGQASAQLFWSSPGQPRQIVPTSQLYAADPPVVEPGTQVVRQTLFSGLVRPTTIDFSPDGERIFIGEQRGIIRVVENGVLKSQPFLDFRGQINGTRDRGLLDIAVHPNFPTTPYVYLIYTYDPPQVNAQASGSLAGPDGNGNRAGRVTRVTADAATNYTTVVAGSEVVLLGANSTWANFNAFANSTFNFDEPPAGILPDGSNLIDFIATDSESHTVGALEFGTDGSLFVSIGDGTSYNRVDPRTTRVQDIDNLSGKILRIDPLTGEGLADNPFFNGDADANRSKVYSLGFRNPFRTAVHPETGELFVGDVGWTQWEEVNVAEPGGNFGWPYFEGGSGTSLRTNGYRDLPQAVAFYNAGTAVEAPLFALNHAASGINAIVVGDFMMGDSIPVQYRGDLLFNDLGQGIVRNISFNADGSVNSVDQFTTGANVVVQIKQAPDGSIYYVDLDDGQVGRWNFVASPASARLAVPDPAPRQGKATAEPAKDSQVAFAAEIGEGQQVRQLDVNGDGRVNPIDALRIINHLNRQQSNGEAGGPMATDLAMMDVSGDGWITPLDALRVINRLNRR